jgi:L-alanine-DL-glutamate epimerase-like enolase superfamily enzyme
LKEFRLVPRRGQLALLVRDQDGAEGCAMGISKFSSVRSLLETLVLPNFKNLAADLAAADAARFALGDRNYKFASLPFWIAVSAVELAIFDLLGRRAGCPVADFLGPRRRKMIAVYLSSMRRHTSPEQEVEDLFMVQERTGGTAVKIKIGGRMSNNADASPGRTKRLLKLTRERLRPCTRLFADANGSYDVKHAVAVGRMMEELGYDFLEEPCPFEDFESQRQIAQSLKILIAGGEQDSSLSKFAWLLENKAVGILQPDIHYNGGLVRTLRVARIAAEHGIPVVPHSPQGGAPIFHAMQLNAVIPNLFPFMEYNAFADHTSHGQGVELELRQGQLAIPETPGLGYTI